jgi:hypothetical protein
MKQQAASFKQQQSITNQQITSLITLVTQMVPNNFGSPMQSPHPPTAYANEHMHPPLPRHYQAQQPMTATTTQHTSPPRYSNILPQPTSPPLAQLGRSGKVMDVEMAPTRPLPVTPGDTEMTNPGLAGKRSKHPEATPPRLKPARGERCPEYNCVPSFQSQLVR